MGDQLFRQSNYSGALHEYSKLGNDVRALLKKAEIYRLERKYDFVKVECQRIIDTTTTTTTTTTEETTQNVIDIVPRQLSAHVMLSEVNLLLGEFEDAKNNAQQALDLISKNGNLQVSSQQVQNMRALVSQATSALTRYGTIPEKALSGDDAKREDYVQCARILHDLITNVAKESLSLKLSRVRCALFAKQFSLVQPELKIIFSRNKNYIPAHLLYAQYLYMLGAPDQARSHIKSHCLNSDPENTQCKKLFRWLKRVEQLSEKAQEQMEAKQWEQVKKTIGEYIELSPQAYNLEQMRSNYCRAMAKTSTEETFNEAIKVCDELINEYRTGSSADSSSSSPDESPSSEFIILARLGKVEAYLKGGDLESAERELSAVESLKSRPSSVEGELNELKRQVHREKKLASQKDYYKILGLDKTKRQSYTPKDIKKAYNKKTMELHPDRVGPNADKKLAAKKYSEVTKAYEVLSDADKKAQYDSGDWDGSGDDPFAGGHRGGFHGGGPGGGGFPFEQFFHAGGGGPGGGFRFHFG